MPHVFEHASSGRAKCRGCRQPIAKDELRFGERLPNPFGDGEVTHWFHPLCAAYKRPDALIEGLGVCAVEVPDRTALVQAAKSTLEKHRLPRIDGAELSPTSQAKCRHCKEPIEKGTWRIRLVFHEEGNFSPGGFIHVACREPYFERRDILEQVLHFSRELDAEARGALTAAMQ
jgi:poly [ADP-ribose] polymerase